MGLALVLAGAVGNLYDRAFAIADVVRYTKDGRTHTIEGMLIREQTNDEVVTIGSWPDKLHPQRIPRAWNLQLWQQGVVRDFVRMEPRIRIWGRSINIWPWVFNVADVLLVGGVGLLMLNFWWERRAEQAARRRVAPSPASSP